jgi:hypothetical protein
MHHKIDPWECYFPCEGEEMHCQIIKRVAMQPYLCSLSRFDEFNSIQEREKANGTVVIVAGTKRSNSTGLRCIYGGDVICNGTKAASQCLCHEPFFQRINDRALGSLILMNLLATAFIISLIYQSPPLRFLHSPCL